MNKIWFKSGQKRILTKYLRRILKKWQLALKKYQITTGDLGYTSPEKANFGFFLWGCAQLKIHFLLEYTTEGIRLGEKPSQRRPDGWIIMDKNTDAVVEAKILPDCLDTEPRKKIHERLQALKRQIRSLKDKDDARYRIALLFVYLWRNRTKARTRSNIKVFVEYLNKLREYPSIDFFGRYLSPEKLINNPQNIDDKWIYPGVVVIGKYV
jgi:hypothetical protein